MAASRNSSKEARRLFLQMEGSIDNDSSNGEYINNLVKVDKRFSSEEACLLLNEIESDFDESILSSESAYQPETRSSEFSEEFEEVTDDIFNEDNEQLPVIDNQSSSRPEKGRKRTHPESRTERKRKANNNETFKGVIKQPKVFDPNFVCGCKKRCTDTVSVEKRHDIFKMYQESGFYEARAALILGYVKQVPKKRTYGRSDRKTFSRIYSLDQNIVCKSTLLNTLMISSKVVDVALKKSQSNSITDKRGMNPSHNKISQEIVQEIISHIDKFPRYKSHYTRAENRSEYLNPELNLTKMCELYKSESLNPVSLSKYKSIFYSSFNLKFKSVQKDTCKICDIMAAGIQSATTDEERVLLEEQHQKHLVEAKLAENLMNKDLKRATTDQTLEVLTYDLQKALPLPRLQTGIIFYKRQLWMYNLGVHSGSDGGDYFYTWLENEAGRGAQEVGSCLQMHIKKRLENSIEHLILWSDSYGGQNGNIKITLFMQHVLQNHPNLKSIKFRYRVSGHSFLPNDSEFGDVESTLKRQQRLYTPDDYTKVMLQCRRYRPFNVTKMNASDFLSTAILETNITNRKNDIDKNKINWLQTREIEIKKDSPNLISFRRSFDSDERQVVDVSKRVGRRSESMFDIYGEDMPALWPDGKKVAEPKIKDLKDMLSLIPDDYKHFYTNLIGDENVVEDIDGFNGDLDFDVEADD